jgi:hypothetical protein
MRRTSRIVDVQLLVGTAFEVAATGAEGRATAFLVDVDTVILGNPADPFWVGGEDGSHFPDFKLGDRIVVARWAMSYEDPAQGASDLGGCFWVVGADGLIDYTRSPKLDGRQPTTLAALLTALSGQPNTAVSEGVSRISLSTFVGLGFLLLSLFLVVWRWLSGEEADSRVRNRGAR